MFYFPIPGGGRECSLKMVWMHGIIRAQEISRVDQEIADENGLSNVHPQRIRYRVFFSSLVPPYKVKVWQTQVR